MPLTKRQVSRILDINSKPMIAPGRLDGNLAARVTESWTRRKLFAWEDKTVVSMYEQYRAAFREMRNTALDMADRAGINKLAGTSDAILFQRQLVPELERIAGDLVQGVARQSFDAAMTAYYAGYYGRAWLLNESTREDAPLVIQPPGVDVVAGRVVLPQLREQSDPRRGLDLLYELLGVEWRQAYANELDTLQVAMRRALNQALAEGDGIPAAMRRVREVLGVETDRGQGYRANFYRVQTITRSYIIEASNAGAIDLYNQNQDVLLGMEWLTQFDGRQCPQCEGLNGQVWTFAQTPMRPVTDTHPNCRCSLIPVINDNWRLPSDVARTQAPRQSFSEFAGEYAIRALLNQFL